MPTNFGPKSARSPRIRCSFSIGVVAFCIMWVAFLVTLTMLGGCTPKVPMPIDGPNIKAGTPVSSEMLTAELAAAERKAEADAKAADAKAARELRKVEREAERGNAAVVAKAQDRADDIAAEHAATIELKAATLESFRAAAAQAQADIEARQTFITTALSVGGAIAQNSGIPGLAALVGPAIGLAGIAFGVKKNATANVYKAKADTVIEHATNAFAAIDVVQEKNPSFAKVFQDEEGTLKQWMGDATVDFVRKLRAGTKPA